MEDQRSPNRSLQEAAAIAIVGIVLGIAYNAVSGRGIELIRKEHQLTWVSDSVQQSSPAEAPQPLLINIDEAYRIFQEGNALFIDSRHEEEYLEGHIKGAISLPLKSLEADPRLVQTIPKDKLIVTYCSGVECDQSIDLGQKLASMGFRNVRIFFAGWNDWQQRNLPIETGRQASR